MLTVKRLDADSRSFRHSPRWQSHRWEKDRIGRSAAERNVVGFRFFTRGVSNIREE
jgi:hypothetical protein